MDKKVAFIGVVDYANCMTEYSTAINKHCNGFISKSICLRPHDIPYIIKHDLDIKNSPEQVEEARNWLKECSHIIIGEESWIRWKDMKELTQGSIGDLLGTVNIFQKLLGIDLVNDTLAGKINNLHLYHTGSMYRDNFHPFNILGGAQFNKIIYGNDLYRLAWNDLDERKIRLFNFPSNYSSKQNVASHVAFNPLYSKDIVRNIINNKFSSNKITIFHAPTQKRTKGTDIIVDITERVIDKINKENKQNSIDLEYWLITPENYPPLKETANKKGWIPNKEILKTKELSHIYIDEFNPKVGYFGVSGVESLMLGNVTMATINNFTPEASSSANQHLNPGDCPVIHLGQTPEEFENILETTLRKSIKELKQLAFQSMEWYFNTSAYEAVAIKFEKEILI